MNDAFTGLIGPVARELLGEPNPRLSNDHELRFGNNGSLSVNLDKDTWYSHETEAGGGVIDLVRLYGGECPGDWLRDRGFLKDEPVRSESPAATYDYVDEHGEILFQVVRKAGHDFRQRRPDGKGGWTWSTKGVKQVPYLLPEILTASAGEPVFVVEGEKDVDNVRALGLLATCNAGGAGKWRDHHAEHLRDRHVVILPDNDEQGRKHAQQVEQSLKGVARSVCVVELPNLPPKGDVSDWIAAGGTGAELLALRDTAGARSRTLHHVDLTGLLSSPTPAPPYVIRGLVPRRVVTLLGGHGGAGKSILGLTLAAHVAGGAVSWAEFLIEDGHALFLSLEDPGEVVRHRLRHIIEAYGLDAAKVERRLTVLDGTNGDPTLAIEANEMGVRSLLFTPTLNEVAEHAAGKRLIVIDNASDAYSANENERRQVRAFVRELARIGVENDAGVILLAHIDKNAARNGSQGNTYSGSTAWHNSARSRLALTSGPLPNSIELVPEKLNHGKLADPVPLAWSESGVLMPVGRSTGEAGADDTEHVLAALRAAQAVGVDVGAARTGPNTAQTTLATFDELPTHLRGPRGRAAFWSAVGKLLASGDVGQQEVVTDQRKRRKVLRLEGCASSESLESARANTPHPYALIGAHGVRGFCAGSAPVQSAQTGADEYRHATKGE